jgi:hypothetical protein
MENRRNTRLLARDIKDSLGKLPPQALDMEEAVLGAIMLEKPALAQIPFLKPEHFYAEAHKEIHRAILDLAASGDPIDMRTVRSRLAKSGKIELIGGAYYLAELTGKVSSAANIEAHARVILEMALKRFLIQKASDIYKLAYEDTSDPIDLLESSITDLQFLKDREIATSGPERIKLLWENTLITDKPEEFPPLITIDESPVATPGNHSLLVGRKKSRKTLFVVWEISKFVTNRNHLATEAAIFDTEQGRKHVWGIRDKIYRMTNQNVPVFYMRGMSPRERRDFIEETVKYWPQKLRIIVIDGIRDLMSNINDPDECTEVVVWLEKLILTHNIHVINILHLNKTDGNARGHIGSELLNKAEVTIELTLDENTGATVVKCESSREKPFEPFMFQHGPTGLPEIIGQTVKGEGGMPDEEKLKRLEAVFEGNALSRRELEHDIGAEFACGLSKSKQLIREFMRCNWIVKSGPDRSINTVYKLVATATMKTNLTPISEINIQPNPQLSIESEDLPF